MPSTTVRTTWLIKRSLNAPPERAVSIACPGEGLWSWMRGRQRKPAANQKKNSELPVAGGSGYITDADQSMMAVWASPKAVSSAETKASLPSPETGAPASKVREAFTSPLRSLSTRT